MATPVRIPLGAPGIYKFPQSPIHALTGVRMDVCAFAGVAPRGPARQPVVNEQWPGDRPWVEDARPRRRSVPVAVESFDEYRAFFGGFKGPGLLPYSVAAFFEQGGRRAYVIRVVHDYPKKADNSKGVASGVVPGAGTTALPFTLVARNEGSWGNKLRAALDFNTRPVEAEPAADLTTLPFDVAAEVSEGTLLRLTLNNKKRVFRTVAAIDKRPRATSSGFFNLATFDDAVAAKVVKVEIVEGVLEIDDGDGRFEHHERLGFSPLHPRWLATVLSQESRLVFPENVWSGSPVLPTDPELVSPGWSEPFQGGDDRYSEITPEDFFDGEWVLTNEEPGEGIHSITQLADLSLLVVPDLYSPFPLPDFEDIAPVKSLAGSEFAKCVVVSPSLETQAKPIADLAGLRLDPRLPADRERIILLQKQLVEFAQVLRSFITLLDVPPGLNQRQILAWRSRFDSAYAASYHPWLRVARRDDSRDALVRVPPSAVAAGIIAKQEIDFGVPHGPANVLGAEVVSVEDDVSPARHDELHPEGINVYLRERDGIRLTAARTLSRTAEYRQLSVRRLMTMIQRALEQQMQWAVFESNSSSLRSEIQLMLRNYLRQLFNIGAFRGATEDEAFFVRCDDSNNPAFIVDAGRLIAEVGVAPAEPLEFIVLRLVRESDGTLLLGER